MRGSVDMNFLFTLGELQRMMRAYADRQAARYGITRAQWAVLAKVERTEGLKQSELAELMEMQPITLTRLIDKLCDNGWIERRGDANGPPRQPPLSAARPARPLLGKLAGLRSNSRRPRSTASARPTPIACSPNSNPIKENVRNAIQTSGERTSAKGAALWLIPSSNSRPSRRATRGKPRQKARRRAAPPR